MGKIEFEQFLETVEKKNETDREFKERELSEWRYYLDLLYNNITENWLSKYIERGLISCKRIKKSIFEEFSGDYEVDKLILSIQGREILVDPIGTMLVGAKGRVELVGKNGMVTLVLVNKNMDGPKIDVKIFTSNKERQDYESQKKNEKTTKVEWEWKIFVKKAEKIAYVVLDENNFYEIIIGLVNG